MKKIYIITFVVVILFTGCNDDFLDTKSLTALADDTFWTSAADAEMALAGCYDALQNRWIYDSNPWAGGAMRYDYMSDNGWVCWGWMPGGDISRGEHSTSSWMIGSQWDNFYMAIVRCNRVIDMVPTLGEEIIAAELATQIVAEAKFIRALVYNLITMTYQDAPLVTTIQLVEEAHIAKSSKSDIVNFIISDLESSVENLPNVGSADWGRATKGAGYALLTRVNLYAGNWTAAASWAQKVIDLGYSLYPDYHGLFQNANEINDEVIFPVRFVRGPDDNGCSHSAYWGSNGINYQEVLPNLGEDFFCVDGKPITESALYNPEVPAENRDPRMGASLVTNNSIWRGSVFNTFSKSRTGYMQRKYVEEQNSENHFDASEDFYVFRLGEVLLMKAEALAESGGSANEIFGLINQLRDRSSVQMPHVDQAEVDTYFGGSIIEMVRHERRIETAFEGLRYFDLVRWGILKERAFDYYMANELPNLNISERHWPGDKQYKWPLPQSEVDRNDLLEQHSEWN